MSGYSEKAQVPVFDSKPENFDQREVQWNAFADVEGISDALGSELDIKMPGNTTVVFTEETLLKIAGKSKKKAVKDNRKCIAFYAIAMKQMKLMRILTKAKTEEWPRCQDWKVRKALVEKYRPDDV
jgi:hypothetical protein